MSVSPFFTDDELISQLRIQFEREKMFDVNWKSIFHMIEERETDYFLRFRGRKFSIDKVTAGIKEVD